MRTRNRDREQNQAEPQAGEAQPGSDAARAKARRLLDLGDEAIRRALSSDSERFLAQNRQQGGQ